MQKEGMKAKVLLIQPPQLQFKGNIKRIVPPLGMAYIGAVLEQDGFDVRILDAYVEGYDNEQPYKKDFVLVGLSWEEISSKVKDFMPDFVGISGMFDSQDYTVVKICEIIKEANSMAKIFVGGSHPTYFVEEILKNPNIDFVIMHEAEYTVRKLLNRLLNNQDLSDIAGLGYIQDGQIKVNRTVEWIKNLDELPMPARHLLSMEKYIKINRPHSPFTLRKRVTQMVTSRGCSAKCYFCTSVLFWGGAEQYRVRSPNLVVDEIEHLMKEYGIDEIHFDDDNFSLNKKNCEEVLDEIIKRKLDIKWATPNGIAVWALDQNLIEKMAKAGCYQLTFAVESGNQEFLLKTIKKPLNLSRVKPLLDKAHECGISVHAFFIIGFPGETKEMILNTLRFAENTGFDSVSIHIATPLFGTELYKICKENGYLVEDFDPNNNIYKMANIITKEFKPEELLKLSTEYMNRINESLKEKNPKLYELKYGKTEEKKITA